MVVVDLVFPFWFYVLLAWTVIWKGIALWYAGRHNQPYWFIAILVLNTLGGLPIIYLLFFRGGFNYRFLERVGIRGSARARSPGRSRSSRRKRK